MKSKRNEAGGKEKCDDKNWGICYTVLAHKIDPDNGILTRIGNKMMETTKKSSTCHELKPLK